MRIWNSVLLVMAAAFAGAWLNEVRHEKPAIAASPKDEAPLLKRSSESFRAVARAVSPAVVVIKTFSGGGGGQVGPRDRRRGRDPFEEFFRHFGGNGSPFGFQGPPGGGGGGGQGQRQGLGSGFIIDKRGFIVTNNHVVQGSTKVVVNLSGAEMLDIPAKVIGTDPRSDLAVIKIEPKGDLTIAQWADSDSVEVGDWAIAIGSPFQLSHTVTAGIVSAKGRSASNVVGSDYGYEMLQTDAAINPGNSGGPLCTMDGKVMGVNTAIFTESGGYMGIGFAIPSNLARSITEVLGKGGKVTRGYLGVVIQPLDEGLADDLKIAGGALVHEVQSGSPARKAGIRPGDVIVSANGKVVGDPGELQRAVSVVKPGDKMKLKVIGYQDKKQREVEVTIGKLRDRAGSSTDEESDNR